MDMDQPCEYLQKFQKYYFLFLEKKVSYLQFMLVTHICKAMIMRAAGLMFRTIHPEKSRLIPIKYINYLGFLLSSVQMTITLAVKKTEKKCSYRRCSYNKISIKTYRGFSSSFSCSNIGYILL